jgi:hypothetical protein
MKIIEPGHIYELNWLDGKPRGFTDGAFPVAEWTFQNQLIFVKREGDKYPGNKGHHPGTNIQEVVRALIDRVKYLDNQIQHERNTFVLQHLRAVIHQLELRAAQRHNRELRLSINEIFNIEILDVCNKCGHIGCEGECHESQ